MAVDPWWWLARVAGKLIYLNTTRGVPVVNFMLIVSIEQKKSTVLSVFKIAFFIRTAILSILATKQHRSVAIEPAKDVGFGNETKAQAAGKQATRS